ncbi:DUF6747 family protein [Muriicola marianensis]|uniref:ABC transporter permease n=1 Tax=Muriicola marianensis TaxID=1324801 RepID=A0ABQ1R1G3_9FLAO|nr:DUF6747 family protein [Muriicola marianensis]GGD54833.1 hypothetical protein GCM10011361_21700 [Muriicola marianensis]
MKSVMLMKELYLEAFKNIGSQFAKSYLKVLSWLFMASYIIVVFAFIFRASTGFAFD